ncbi:MAG: hypothetical protein HY811_11150 [Planctomycetes bacterium]|nr:hypothetical protein [Planctomycetota bacterium]
MRNILCMCFALFCLFLYGNLAQAESLEVIRLDAGLDGYYRPGSWCPVRLKISSGGNPFNGYLEIDSGQAIYKKPLEIPPHAQKDISFPILIYSSSTTIKHRLIASGSETPVKEGLIPIKPVEQGKFLIGVEKRLYNVFMAEFGRFTEAARHSEFFTFLPDDLPHEYNYFEPVDLLVISYGTYCEQRLKPAFDLWQGGRKGNLMVVKDSDIDLNMIARFTRKYNRHLLISPEISGLFEKPRWFPATEKGFLRFSLLYVLFILIIGIIGAWACQKKKYYLIIVICVAVLNLLSFGLIGALGVAPPDFITERLHLLEFVPAQDIVIDDDFMAVHPSGFNELTVETGGEFYKPLYENINILNASTLAVSYADGKTAITQKRQAGASMVLGRNTVRKNGLMGRIDCRLAENGYKYKIINESETVLDDCFIMTRGGCRYLGKISGGEVKEINPEGGEFTDLNNFMMNYLTGENKSVRYKNRLLKLWLARDSKLDDMPSGGYLAGWNTVPGKRDAGSYPELWIIPFETCPPSK